MKKWEEQNRLKIHQKKIHDAKSTLAPNFKSKEVIPDNRPISNPKAPSKFPNSNTGSSTASHSPTRTDTSNSIRTSSTGISGYFDHEKDDLNSIPLYKLLKFYNLQQYAKALISRNYGYDLSKLAKLGKVDIEQLKSEIKLLPGHEMKFLNLLTQIKEVCQDIQEESTKKVPLTHLHRKNSPLKSTGVTKPISLSNKDFSSGIKTRINGKLPIDKKKKLKLERIGFDFFRDSQSLDDEFTKTLEQILEKYKKEGDIKGLPHELFQKSQKIIEKSSNFEQTNRYGMKLTNYPQNYDFNSAYQKEFSKGNFKTLQVKIFKDDSNSLLQRVNYSKAEDMKRDLSMVIDSINSSRIEGSIFKDDNIKNVKSTREIEQFIKLKDNQKPILIQQLQNPINFKPQINSNTHMSSHVMRILEKKLNTNDFSVEDLHLQVKKIKDLYNSIDGAKMTSTLVNIDIEEMCYCFAQVIKRHIQFFLDNIYPNDDTLNNNADCIQEENEEKEYDIIKENMILSSKNQTDNNKFPSKLGYYKLDYIEKGDISIVNEKVIQDNNYNIERVGHENTKTHNDNHSKTKIEIGDIKTNQEIETFLKETLRESVLGNTKQNQIDDLSHQGKIVNSRFSISLGNNDVSLNESMERKSELISQVDKDKLDTDLEFSFESMSTTSLNLDDKLDISQKVKKIFEKTYTDKDLQENEKKTKIMNPIEIETIANFCHSIILTSKMEKEVIIICLIYIERLIIKTGQLINPINWRKLIFTALIIASKVNFANLICSKIWDDESFENENFSKAFSIFTTKEINELERVFLEFIDYDLGIKSSEYAKYYFILRTFAEKDNKRFPLKALDVNTVIMLQKNSNKISQSLKDRSLQKFQKTF